MTPIRVGLVSCLLLALVWLVPLVSSAPTTGYLYHDHPTGNWRFTTSRVAGAQFDGPGCSDSDLPGDALLSWQVGGCSGPVASVRWRGDILKRGWDELTVSTSARFDDRTQAYGAGYIEGWMTHERIYSLVSTLIRQKKSPPPAFLTFLTRHDAYLRRMVQQHAPIVFQHGTKIQGTEPNYTEEHAFWYNVGLTLRQLDGMLAGYNARASADRQITLIELIQLNDDGDKLDIERAIAFEAKMTARAAKLARNATSFLSVHSEVASDAADAESTVTEATAADAESDLPRPVASMTRKELLELVAFSGHCSALVRFTGDDLLIGHNTWSDYDLFLRIYKNFNFNFHHPSISSQSVAFTSYPGFLASSDDFYVTSRGSSLVLTETTLTILDETLYLKHVESEGKGVMSWIRNIIANRRAATGQEWVNYFAQHASGTYNDAWLIVDMARFESAKAAHSGTPARRPHASAMVRSSLPAGAGTLSPLTASEALSPPVNSSSPHVGSSHGGLTLLPETFFLLEQIPGYIETRDLTSILQEVGYFGGYNLPFTRTVAEKSMYVSYARELKTPSLEYATSTRAKIFAKEAPIVNDVEGMKRLLRKNDYQLGNASLTRGCPSSAIAARYDLPHLPGSKCEIETIRLNGAIDGKVVNAEMVKTGTMELISGPTSSSTLPPFDWNHRSIPPKKRARMHSVGSPVRFDFPWIKFRAGTITPLPLRKSKGVNGPMAQPPRRRRRRVARKAPPRPPRRNINNNIKRVQNKKNAAAARSPKRFVEAEVIQRKKKTTTTTPTKNKLTATELAMALVNGQE